MKGDLRIPQTDFNAEFLFTSIHLKNCFNYLMKKIIVILWMGIGVYACKKKDSNFTSRITFLNAFIDAAPPTYSLKLNMDTVITKVSFPTITYNRTVPSGTFDVNLEVGTLSPTSFRTNFESNRDYLCFTYDSLSRPKLFFQKEAVPDKITDGRCAIRFFSLIPSTGNLALENDTNKIFLAGQTFNSFSNTFTEIDTTSRPLKIVMIGATSMLLDSVPNRPLVSGKVYTVFFTGSINGTGNQKPKMIFWQHN